MSFVHLHTHSEYSVLDSIIKVKQLVSKAKDFGQESIALTDHSAMYGVYEFWKECHEQNIKPILGCEVNVANKSRFDRNPTEKSYNLIILAKNLIGYQNLVKIVTASNLEGFYYKPRIDRELLEKHKDGLIILSGYEWSELVQNFILGDTDKAENAAAWYKKTFGDDYYIEVLRVGSDHEDENNTKIINLANKLDIKLFTGADAHYMEADDYAAREVAWAISDGKKMSDPSRKQDKTHQYYMKSPDEMIELWKDFPQAIKNTQEISDKIEDYKIGYGKVEPKCLDVPTGLDASKWLRQLAYEGGVINFLQKETANRDNANLDEKVNEAVENISNKVSKENENQELELPKNVIDRLEYELGIINSKGYNDYFLVVREYVKWANDQGIPTTCRGSGASSLVAYCIGVTPLDPLHWKLPFERFLNPERESFPDFDIDFADDRRELVFKHMQDKYGADRTSNICAIGRMKSRAIIRDVGRVMGVPLSITDKLSKLVTVKFGKPASLKEMMDPEKHPEFAAIVNESDDLKYLIKMASKLENNMRQVGTHACGFLYTPEPVTNYIPLQKETKGGDRIISQIEGGKMENLGLMKFDFLGISNLSTIALTVSLVQRNHGITLDMRNIPIDDPKTFELLQKADTAGVFQLESEGMRKYLKSLKPTTVEDISFMCAAYRPGPMQFIEPYINRKHGREKVTYPHAVLIPVLEETYGYAIYQEQVMEIARVFSGYTLGAADMLRRAMGKKIAELMAKEKLNFIEGAQKMGHTQAEAEKIFSYLEPFADYGFNKAHSAAYAMIAYQTAYLKANFPIEFIAALMQTDLDDSTKLTRDIVEAQNHGIAVLSPDINYSFSDFSIEEPDNSQSLNITTIQDSNLENKSISKYQNGQIRFGLGGLKSVGVAQVDEIVRARDNKKFESFEDFITRVDIKKVSKNAVEVLIKVGAFEEFGKRSQLLEIFESAYESAQKLSKMAQSNSISMFGDEETFKIDKIRMSDIDEVAPIQKVEWEKEYLGIYFSQHPLSKISAILQKRGVENLTYLKKKARVGDKVKIAATIKKMRCVVTKKDSKKMCFGVIEDADFDINFTIFPRAFEKYEANLKEGRTYIFEGKKDFRDEQHGILVDDLKEIDFAEYEGLINNLDIKNDLKSAPFENLKTENNVANKSEIKFKNNISNPANQKIPSTDQKKENSNQENSTNIQKSDLNKVNNKANDKTDAKAYNDLSTEIQNSEINSIRITLPATTPVEKLKQLNEFFMQNQGSAEITLILKPASGLPKTMILNNKLDAACDVNTGVKNIVEDAMISVS